VQGKAAKATAALTAMLSPLASVRRDGVDQVRARDSASCIARFGDLAIDPRASVLLFGVFWLLLLLLAECGVASVGAW